MKNFFIITILAGLCFSGYSQTKEPKAAWLFKPSAAVQVPGGDMADVFGTNFTTGFGVGYKTKSNWTFSIDGQYLFSDNIENTNQVLGAILTDRGYILNEIGNYSDIGVVERGFYFTAEMSKTLDFWQVNPNSGPDILLGAGYLQHWILIKNTGNDTPQLLGEYKKGYDQLSAGFLLKQSLGYTYLSSNRRINFRLSFEVMQGFTENLRGFNYSTGQKETGGKLDLLYGLRLQWILPVYSAAKDAYFYD